MNREERLRCIRELYRSKGERQTTDKREKRLARQREYMRHRCVVLTDQQSEQIL